MTHTATPTAGARLEPANEPGYFRTWREAIAQAVLAPSSHNTQPWLFHLHPTADAAELYADRTRALPVADPHDRELTISCGSALEQLLLGVRAQGFAGEVELLPDDADADLLARVRLGAPRSASAEELALHAAIPTRRTTRRRFDDRIVPDTLAQALVASAEAEGAHLLLLADAAERERLAELVAEADRRQAQDPAFRRELASWMHPNRSRSRDGMPGYAHALGAIESLVTPFVVRTFDWGSGQAARDRDLAAGSPLMAVLWTDGDGAADWLRAGMALSRVLLRAAADGLTASYLNQPLELPELREAVRSALGIAGAPQIILRLGYGPEVRATPRRPLDEVIV